MKNAHNLNYADVLTDEVLTAAMVENIYTEEIESRNGENYDECNATEPREPFLGFKDMLSSEILNFHFVDLAWKEKCAVYNDG